MEKIKENHKILKLIIKFLILIILTSWSIYGIYWGTPLIQGRIEYINGKETYEIISASYEKMEEILQSENFVCIYEYKFGPGQDAETMVFGGGVRYPGDESGSKFSFEYDGNGEKTGVTYNKSFYYKDGRYKREFVFPEEMLTEYGIIEDKGEQEKIAIFDDSKTKKEIRIVNLDSNTIYLERGGIGDLTRWYKEGQKASAKRNLRTEKYNERECYVITEGNEYRFTEVWIDKETMLIVRDIGNGSQLYEEFNNITFSKDTVTDEELKIPSTEEYEMPEDVKVTLEEYFNL